MLRYLCLTCLILLSWPLGAQSVIAFRNASLEGSPRVNTAPHDWYYCNFPGESPPDIHPAGLYRVQLPAADGATYVGLVCRDNGTFESIGQHLPTPLPAGTCYRWRARVARSSRYRAIVRSTLRPGDFAAPVRLALYGGPTACDRAVVLGLSDSIVSSDWYALEIMLRVTANSEHLRIGVIPFGEQARNGHVLIDAIEPLLPCDCTTGEPLRDLPELPTWATPDWEQTAAQLDAHLRHPRTGITAFRYRQRTYQGLKVLASLVDYLQQTDRQVDVGIRLGDRQAYRAIRLQLLNRLNELELTKNHLRFKRLKTPPGRRWIGANPGSILYLHPR